MGEWQPTAGDVQEAGERVWSDCAQCGSPSPLVVVDGSFFGRRERAAVTQQCCPDQEPLLPRSRQDWHLAPVNLQETQLQRLWVTAGLGIATS